RSATRRSSDLDDGRGRKRLSRIGLAVSNAADVAETRRGIGHGAAIANGMDLARNLGNRPPNVCTPSHLAEQAKALAAEHDKLDVEVLTEIGRASCRERVEGSAGKGSM